MKDLEQQFLEADSMAVDQDFCLYRWEGPKSKFGVFVLKVFIQSYFKGKKNPTQQQKRVLSGKGDQAVQAALFSCQ